MAELDLTPYLTILRSTPHRIGAIHSALKGSEFLTYRVEPDTFSFIDIMAHLIHGEVDDWIPRIQLILGQDPSANDPPTFVPFDRFAGDRLIVENTIVELVDLFFVRRNQSMETLVNFGLEEHHLEWKGIHPSLGEVTLQWLLNTWVEHDLSHLNQINRVISTKFSDVGPWKEYLRILKE